MGGFCCKAGAREVFELRTGDLDGLKKNLFDSQASSRRANSPGEVEITVNHNAFLRPNQGKDLLMVGVWMILPQLCPQGTVVQWKSRSLLEASGPQANQACPCQECPKEWRTWKRGER